MGLEQRPSWAAGLDTGVEAIDAEHRLQVSLISALEELVRGADGAAPVQRLLAQLLEFSEVHFGSEELMMRVYGYPRLEAHRAEHARLLVQLQALVTRVRASEVLDGPSALQGLGDLRRWLTQHIATFDQAFTAWVAGAVQP